MYGDPVVEYCEDVWERLMRMTMNRTGAWLIMGDFNEITNDGEKKGGKKDHILPSCRSKYVDMLWYD